MTRLSFFCLAGWLAGAAAAQETHKCHFIVAKERYVTETN